MTSNNRNGTLVIIPNLLSGFRLIAAPFLLCIAWFGYHNMFLVLLAISLFTDSDINHKAKLAILFEKLHNLGLKIDDNINNFADFSFVYNKNRGINIDELV